MFSLLWLFVGFLSGPSKYLFISPQEESRIKGDRNICKSDSYSLGLEGQWAWDWHVRWASAAQVLPQ